jgi:hypothetical protein
VSEEHIKRLVRETLAENQSHQHTHDDRSNEKAHFVPAWDAYCAQCGEPNPDFKPEVRCKSCGRVLGSRQIAEKLKACPTCGGHEAEPI